MITQKAIELRKVAMAYLDTHAPGDKIATRMANEFWDELFDHCKPTSEEWEEIANRMTLTCHALYLVWKKK